jgi:hypothetical protein
VYTFQNVAPTPEPSTMMLVGRRGSLAAPRSVRYNQPGSDEMQPHDPGRDSGGILLRDGLISAVAVLLAFGAFDDITTDNATRFTVEYTSLAACAVWFGFVAMRLIRLGRRTLGLISLVALLAAFWAQRGIGPGMTPDLWPQYGTMLVVFVWFLVLAATLVVLGWRRAPRPAISHR